MPRPASVLVFIALVASTIACSCVAQPERTLLQMINIAKTSDNPYAVATLVSEDRPANINAQVTYTFRLEGCLNTVLATTCGNSACCGVAMMVNKKYLVRLNKDGSTSSIDSCTSFPKLYDNLSAADRQVVKDNVPSRCGATSCAAVLCLVGTICRDGKCIDNSCDGVIRCPPGTICRNRKCVNENSCPSKPCGRGYKCINGKCVRIIPRCYLRCYRGSWGCKVVGCPRGWGCRRGACVRPAICFKKCTDVLCVQAPCPPSCVPVRCSDGFFCHKRKCIRAL